jgi:hypothetical protein
LIKNPGNPRWHAVFSAARAAPKTWFSARTPGYFILFFIYPYAICIKTEYKAQQAQNIFHSSTYGFPAAVDYRFGQNLPTEMLYLLFHMSKWSQNLLRNWVMVIVI